VDESGQKRDAGRLFATTNWSLVVAAGSLDDPGARDALEVLCQRYWYPVYALVRHFGHRPDRAEDLTQGFFLSLLERRSLQAADQDRGRFRSFLKTLLRNYLTNEHTRKNTRKRGGNARTLRVDFADAEARYGAEASPKGSPEATFERRWARAVLSRGLEKLRAELRDSPDAERWKRLEPFLTGNSGASTYRKVAAELGLSESAVKVAVHRLRKRYGKALRAEVAQTVSTPEDVDEEVRYLLIVVDS
jgi:RNA polymerase sigma-70 factor (ECF subfamily)